MQKRFLITLITLFFSYFLIAQNPTAIEYAKQGEEHIAKGEWAKASHLFTRALEFEPKNVEYYLRRGWALLHDNKNRRALADFKEAGRLDKTNGEAVHLKAVALDSLKNFVESKKEYIKAIKLLGDKNPQLYLSRGNSFLIQKDYNNAVANLNVAIQLDRKNGKAYYLRGIARVHLVDSMGACNDWSLAKQFGFNVPDELYNKNCKE
jgi:Flp pilus assembly protein TadD